MLLLGGAFLLAPVAGAEVEITPHVAFLAGGAVATRQGDLTFDPAAALGLTLGWRVRHDGLLELVYTRQDTEIELDSRPLFDATLDHLHGAGVWEIETGRTRPYIGLGLGASRLDPGLGGLDEEWMFSAGMYGGVKHWFRERLGLRVEGRGLLHVTGSGDRIFCGFAGGASGCAAELTGDGFAQLEVQVGLVVRP
jgi:hypothetical protein